MDDKTHCEPVLPPVDRDIPVFPEWMFNCGMDTREMRIYCHICCKNPLWSSYTRIAKHCRISVPKVKEAIAGLVRKGLVLYIEHRGGIKMFVPLYPESQ